MGSPVVRTADRAAPAALPPRDADPPFTFWRWAAAVAVVLAWLCGVALLVRHVELVTGRYISGGVPPVLAVGALLLLLGVRAGCHRLAARLPWLLRLAPDRRQMLLVFVLLCVGIGLNGQYMVRALLPHLVSLQYWSTRGNAALGRWVEYFPAWYAPADTVAIARYFDGGGGPVPWNLWIVPLLRWSILLVAIFVAGAGLMGMIRRQWVHAERLTFPMLWLPLSLTGGTRGATAVPLAKDPLLWLGFGVAAVFNGLNIGRALNPALPAPGFYYSFSGQFTETHLRPLNTVMLFFMLEAIGFGYFLPLEVSFSTWFFYVAEKVFAVGGLAAGYEGPGFPYMQHQSAGAYLAVALLVLYGARRHLLLVVRRALGLARPPTTPDEREERSACYCFAGGTVVMLAWVWAAGFHLAVALPYFAVLFCFVLVYARIRAETGVPYGFVYPYDLPKELVVGLLTPRGILDTGGPRTWVTFSSMAWLSRHHYAMETAAYTLDGMRLAEETRTQRRWLYAGLAVVLVFGLALAAWSHLSAYYAVGSNLAGGGRAEYRATVALDEYRRMAQQATMATPRDVPRLAAQAAGFTVALSLGILRTLWVRCPFHPLGYVLATAYGDHSTFFFPMLMAWLCKATALKVGGLPVYRRFIPLFLGLIVGHYSLGGFFWPVFSLLLPVEARSAYHLYFGG